MVNIDHTKPLYLDLVEDENRIEQIILELIKCGFQRKQIALREAGTIPNKGDYVARMENFMKPPRVAVYQFREQRPALGGYTWEFEPDLICTIII